jgi:hypothetical protein
VVARLVALSADLLPAIPSLSSGPVLWGYGPKKTQIVNGKTPPRPSNRILGIASDAASGRSVSRCLAEIPASAFHAKSIHNRQSFSEFRDLATVSRTFEEEANVLGIATALFTGQAIRIGPALATE